MLYKKRLTQLPDCKKFPLTINKEYEIIRSLGNGYVIRTDDNKESILVLQSRFDNDRGTCQ